MIRNWHVALLGAVLFAPACVVNAQTQDAQRRPLVTLTFTHFDATIVLNAIARRAHVNIIMPEESKADVSVRFNNVPIEDAIQLVAAMAGLVSRNVKGTYFVTKPESMRAVLEQVGVKKRLSMEPYHLDATATASVLAKLFPYLTARALGASALLLIGAPSDIADAETVLQEMAVPAPRNIKPQWTVVRLRYVMANAIVTALKKVYPKLTVLAVNAKTLILIENEPDGAAALDTIKKLDAPSLIRTPPFIGCSAPRREEETRFALIMSSGRTQWDPQRMKPNAFLKSGRV